MNEEFEAQVKQIMHNLKHCIAEPRAHGIIPVRIGGGQAAKLRIVTIEDLKNEGLIKKFAQWRKKHEEWFPAKFKVSVEGTRKWLDVGVLENRDRVLFSLEDMEGRAMGHMGFYRFDFEARICEVDNIVRGEEGIAGLMTEALKAMMAWGLCVLQVEGYMLQTPSDNSKAIALYERCGFVAFGKIAHVRKEVGDRVEWVRAGEGEEAQRYVLEMKYSPEECGGAALAGVGAQKAHGSDIRDMSIECDKVGGINLSQGICDMGTPKEVVEGAKKAMDKGLNYYTRFDGIDKLREAIAKKMAKYNGIKADAKKNIIVSGGATGALFCTCLALLKSGDEVVLFEPYYSYHLDTLLAVGAKPVFVKTRPPRWEFRISELEAAIGAKTKAIIINTPSNPSGKVFSREELLQIAKVCKTHNLMVFTDEIYEYFVYGGAKHVSPASLPELADRTVTISGYSKTFSITGWRIGYAVCNERWAAIIGQINDLLYVCAPSPLQAGVAAGIEKLPKEYYEKIKNEHLKKREMLAGALKKIGLEPYVPQGAYYMLADASSVKGGKGREKAMEFLRQTGIATVPGRAFYHGGGGEDILRFCFAKDEKVIDEACKRILKFGGK